MFSRERVVLVVILLSGALVAAPGLAGASSDPAVESAIAFVDTSGAVSTQGNTTVEVRFDRKIDLSKLENGNLTVGLRQRTITPTKVLNGTGNDDRQFFLDLGSATEIQPVRVSNVSVRAGRTIVDTDGTRHAAADVPVAAVTGTTTTLTEGGQGPLAWRGETVAIVGDEAGEEIEVRPRTGSDIVDQVAIPDDGQVFALETEELPETWYEVYFDGRSSFDASAGDAALELANVSMELTVNDNPDKDDATVTDEENLTGTVSTNTAGEPLSLVVRDDEETVRQTQVTTDGSGEATFSFDPLRDFPDEDWHFTLVATHVASGETVLRDVKVSEVDHDAGFGADGLRETRGDVVEIPIRLSPNVGDRVAADRATVVVGSEEVNYRAVLTVYDGNNDHRVDLEWNSYLADGAGGDEEFTVADTDSGEREDAVTVEAIETTVDGGPTEVLDPTLYPVSVRAGPDRGDAPANATNGAVLEERPPAAMEVFTAPIEAYEEFGELRRAMTPTRQVATEQYVVVTVETPGLFGDLAGRTDLAAYFVASDESEVAGDGVELTIEEAPSPNRDPKRLAAGDVDQVYTDPANDTVALLVDTGAVEWLADGQFQAVWRLDEDHGLIEVADDEERAEAAETNRTEFAVAAPDVTLDGKTEAGRLAMAPSTAARVTGDTTLAPGTELQVRLDLATGGLKLDETTVSENRSFGASFDLAGVPAGTNFTVTVAESGRIVSETVDGSVESDSKPTSVEETTEREPETTPTSISSTPTLTATEDDSRDRTRRTTTDGATTTAAQTPTSPATRTETPGFGWLPFLTSLGIVASLVRNQ